MQLKMIPRSAAKKSEALRLRRAGYIPAVIYSQGRVGETISVKEEEYSSFLRTLPQGRLPTTVVTLTDENGQSRRAIIKDIQYNPVTYAVITLDFQELHDDQEINVKIPIECTGVADCVGIKQGGVMRQVIRHVKVCCLPKDMPAFFNLDISALSMRQSLRLSNLQWPEGVRPLADLNEVTVAIVKR
jgi:large subunit ribosomal protein L25